MRKLSTILLAVALVLGIAQCKKEQPTPQSEGNVVTITLNVEDGNNNGSRVNVNPTGENQVTFTDGDQILVASGGKYVGSLTKTGSGFSGSIANPVEGQKLYFYFLGNKADITQLAAGSSTTCTVNISDQTTEAGLPVISMGKSDETYPSSDNSYSARLYNKCSLMKFTVNTPSTAPICITGMNNKVTVNFGNPTDDGFEYGMDGDGVIKMQGVTTENTETWAIVLPQEGKSEGNEGTAFTEDGICVGQRPAIHAIEPNKYYHEGDDVINMAIDTYTALGTPLTFEAKAAGSMVTFTAASSDITMQYNTYDGNGWKPYTSVSSIELTAVGDKVSFRGDNNSLAPEFWPQSKFTNSGQCYIYGNIMSLLYSTDYATATTLNGDYTFLSLFYDNKYIYSHPDNALVLPATTLTSYCYQSMFQYCSNLTSAPALPAEALTQSCYSNMFEGCGALTSAPELSAEALAPYCYYRMFYGCWRLTTAPSLPATTIANYCYCQMFNGCSGLTSAPDLPAQNLVQSCYQEMFDGCFKLGYIKCLATNISATDCTTRWVNGIKASGTFVTPSTTAWTTGVNGIPSDWTRVDAQ